LKFVSSWMGLIEEQMKDSSRTRKECNRMKVIIRIVMDKNIEKGTFIYILIIQERFETNRLSYRYITVSMTT